jgi:lipopolysaccharide export system permease protein
MDIGETVRRFIIERYIIREALANFFAVVAVLLLIYLSNRFVRYLAEAAAGELDSGVILELLLLKLTANSVILLPLSMYLGILLALGRFHRDNEIIALQAGGVGNRHLVRAVVSLSLVFAMGVGAMSMWVAPLAADNVAELTRKARNDSDVTGLYPGRFKEFGGGDHIIYVREVSASRAELTDVFVQMRRDDGLDIVYAKTGRQFIESRTGDRFMVLSDGHRYEGSPGSADFVVHAFETHGVRIKKKVGEAAERQLESMSMGELLDGGSHTHFAELQWRISMPLAAVLLAVLAVPLARTSPRSGKYGKLFTAVLVYFVYSNCLSIAQKAVERGELDPFIGVWPVHGIMAIAVAIVLFTSSGGFARLNAGRSRPADVAG